LRCCNAVDALTDAALAVYVLLLLEVLCITSQVPTRARSADAGPVKSVDPSVVAVRRALQRKKEVDAMAPAEDTTLLDDVAAAEEDYDEPEEVCDARNLLIIVSFCRSRNSALLPLGLTYAVCHKLPVLLCQLLDCCHA
jgi:hypothetical protein